MKLYKYGKDNLPMKILKNLHEVRDFVNPRNENLKQSTIRQRIIASLKKGGFGAWIQARSEYVEADWKRGKDWENGERWNKARYGRTKNRATTTLKKAP